MVRPSWPQFFFSVASPSRLATVAVATLVAGLLTTLQLKATFADPDAYYHAAIAEIMAEGIVRSFPWLPLTIFSQYFTDHHLLYHGLLVPFAAVFGGLTGVKVATVVFGVIVVVAFTTTLRHLSVVAAPLWVLLAFLTEPFLYRMALVKALPISLLILFAGILALANRRHWWLIGIAALYVWAYGGWPLLGVVAIAFSVSRLVLEGRSALHSALASLVAVGLGSVFGLVVNPYFPENLRFYQAQVIDIAATPTVGAGVGQEWLPIAPAVLFLRVFPLVVTTLALLLPIIFQRIAEGPHASVQPQALRQRETRIALTALSGVLVIMTMLAVRYVEYLVPISFAALGMWATYGHERGLWGGLWRSMRRQGIVFVVLITFAIELVAVIEVGALRNVYRLFNDRPPLGALAGVANALEQTEPAGALTLNLRWDEFPGLFYFNRAQRYAWGLDPRFWGEADNALSARRALIEGDAAPLTMLARRIGASTVVVGERDRTEALEQALAEEGYRERFRDEYASLYVFPD